MSRAFVNEDAQGPEKHFNLPKRDDPGFDEAAAWALLEGARDGDTYSAERATGYRFGEPALRPHVERILQRVRQQKDERLVQAATRFLERSGS
jgi:hypothetical protein